VGITILDLLFPKFCCGCSRIGTYLCNSCYNQLDFIPLPLQLRVSRSYLIQAQAAVRYEEPIKTLLHECKYQGVANLGKWCASLLYYTVVLPEIDLITSVPLHEHKLKHRGYNQAEIIAKQLAFLLGKPYQQCLIKNRNTSSQAATSSVAERFINLQQAFSVHPSLRGQPISIFSGKSILLIDDVITTGSTLNECALPLVENGAKQVFGLAVAHGF
jgi:competence protein ComFC